MGTLVHKYGGTSVNGPERIRAVARRIAAAHSAGNDMVVVVSAMGDATDELIALARQVSPSPNRREMDMLLTTGERVSMALVAMALHDLGVEAISFTGSQSGILTDSAHANARIVAIRPERILAELARRRVVIVAGFQGVCPETREITTLGRGGSDTSAVAVAAALKADECLIYTDVDGVYTTDPRIVPEARRLHTISFEEMLEMASLGSKVLQIRSVEFAGKYRVPMRVLSTWIGTKTESPPSARRSPAARNSRREAPSPAWAE